jgi:hypothetical protein
MWSFLQLLDAIDVTALARAEAGPGYDQIRVFAPFYGADDVEVGLGSPWRMEGICIVYPSARHVSERGHGHPDGFPVQLEFTRTRSFALAVRSVAFGPSAAPLAAQNGNVIKGLPTLFPFVSIENLFAVYLESIRDLCPLPEFQVSACLK